MVVTCQSADEDTVYRTFPGHAALDRVLRLHTSVGCAASGSPAALTPCMHSMPQQMQALGKPQQPPTRLTIEVDIIQEPQG